MITISLIEVPQYKESCVIYTQAREDGAKKSKKEKEKRRSQLC